MEVGAGDVHLEDADLRAFCETPCVFGVFLEREPADIGDERAVEVLGEPGQLIGYDRVDAGVLETDGVEHARWRLGDAGQGIAETRLGGRALQRDGAEDIEIVPFGELAPEAEGAGGGDDGIMECDAGKRHGKVWIVVVLFGHNAPHRFQLQLYHTMFLDKGGLTG